MARDRRTRRPAAQTLTQMLPNLLTVGAICAGLTAIRFAMSGRFDMAVALILLAALLDGIDGRIARLLKSESAIGAELDSLADFLNFGVAPGLFLYIWSMQDAPREGWIAVLIYAVCCVLRLARFNVDSKSSASDADRAFFVGIPAPAGAFLALLPYFAWRLFPGAELPHFALIAGWIVLIGLLLISRLPTPSLKTVRVRTERVRYLVIALVAVAATLFTYPWAVLIALDVAYLALVVASVRKVRRSRRANGH